MNLRKIKNKIFSKDWLIDLKFFLLEKLGWYWLKYRIWDKHHILKLRYIKPGWCDKDEILIHAMFEVLCRFIEDEKPDEIVDWNSDEEHKFARKEMQELYEWWKKRQDREKEDPIFQEGIKSPHLDFVDYKDDSEFHEVEFNYINEEEKEKWNKACDESAIWQDKCNKEDEEMMIRLIKIRYFMWT